MTRKPQKKLLKEQRRAARRKAEDELAELQRRIDEIAAADAAADAPGDAAGVGAKSTTAATVAAATRFSDLPILSATLQGLTDAAFLQLTAIQRQAIPVALTGADVMGTARTGLGKTLAFLVPVVEALVRARISEHDGLAALIILPTRELAVQTFEVLTKIGKHNSFLAALVTGGKDLKYEKERVARMNVLVGTPGRVAQHLNEAVGMETANLQVLVLDEADRCLDMGFRRQIDSIVGHLPPTRQTLLFLATQLQLVEELARLSMAAPKRITAAAASAASGAAKSEGASGGAAQSEGASGGSANADGDFGDPASASASVAAASAAPPSLSHYYLTLPLDEKLNTLWSFIKLHLKAKILVFFLLLKQVQYAYESFRTLQPGILLLQLYGRHKHTARVETTHKFRQAQHACLFATDIVARGMDFPAIDWVVQVDCPEDAATYVHRVGRAARFGRRGHALLMLAPLETPMLQRLAQHHCHPKQMSIKAKARKLIRPQLQLLCFHDPVMKNLGQRAFILYARLVHVQHDREVFRFDELPWDKYAELLGLPGAPQIKLGSGNAAKERKNQLRQLLQLERANAAGDLPPSAPQRTKYDRMFERQNQTVLSKPYLSLTDHTAADDDFITVKRRDHALVEEELPDPTVPVLKRQAKRALLRKLSKHGSANKVRFDDEGNPHAVYELGDEADFELAGDARTQQQQFVEREAAVMGEADAADKEHARQKRQDKKRKRREAERRARGGDSDGDGGDGDDSDVDLDRDLERGEALADAAVAATGPRWFEQPRKRARAQPEVAEPQLLEDLEALTQRLLHE